MTEVGGNAQLFKLLFQPLATLATEKANQTCAILEQGWHSQNNKAWERRLGNPERDRKAESPTIFARIQGGNEAKRNLFHGICQY
jgi:hypothetical protein